MTQELFGDVEAKVKALVEQHRTLRDAHRLLEEEARDRKDAFHTSRLETERALVDLRAVLGSAVRILREE